MALNSEKLAQRNSASDLLKAFLLKEVEFRIDSKFITIPELSAKAKLELIKDLADELYENSDDIFNYDAIDGRLQMAVTNYVRV